MHFSELRLARHYGWVGVPAAGPKSGLCLRFLQTFPLPDCLGTPGLGTGSWELPSAQTHSTAILSHPSLTTTFLPSRVDLPPKTKGGDFLPSSEFLASCSLLLTCLLVSQSEFPIYPGVTDLVKLLYKG